jgi:prepilin peptidase CpaA
MAALTRDNIARYVTGSLAVALVLCLLPGGRGNPVLLAASAFLLLICATDTLYARIPNLASLLIAATGLGCHLHDAGASGLLFSFLGLLTGLALLIVPYLMGGMGAGDVKALAALGALLGPAATFQVFLYTALFGGLLAIFHYALAHNLQAKCLEGLHALKAFAYTRNLDAVIPSGPRETLRFPYAAAIAMGFFAYVSWGGLL